MEARAPSAALRARRALVRRFPVRERTGAGPLGWSVGSETMRGAAALGARPRASRQEEDAKEGWAPKGAEGQPWRPGAGEAA